MLENKSQKKVSMLVAVCAIVFVITIVVMMSVGSGNWFDRILDFSNSKPINNSEEVGGKGSSGAKEDAGMDMPNKEFSDGGTKMEGGNLQPADNGTPIN